MGEETVRRGPAIDPLVLQDIRCVEHYCTLLGRFGFRARFWETFTLLKTSRSLLQKEVERLSQVADPKSTRLDSDLAIKLRAIQLEMGMLADQLHKYLVHSPVKMDHMSLELAMVFILSSATAREAAVRWVSDPEGTLVEAKLKLRVMGGIADAYRKALVMARTEAIPTMIRPAPDDDFMAASAPAAETPAPPPAPPAEPVPPAPVAEAAAAEPAPAPEPATPLPTPPEAAAEIPPPAPAEPPRVPEGDGTKRRAAPTPGAFTSRKINHEFLTNLRYFEVGRELLDGLEVVEGWDLLTLLVTNRDESQVLIKEMLTLKKAGKKGEFAGEAYRLREKIHAIRAQFSIFARDLRAYAARLFSGWQGETQEIALTFLVASNQGRHRAKQWLDDPELCKEEASNTLVGLLGRARMYQEALVQAKQAKASQTAS